MSCVREPTGAAPLCKEGGPGACLDGGERAAYDGPARSPHADSRVVRDTATRPVPETRRSTPMHAAPERVAGGAEQDMVDREALVART